MTFGRLGERPLLSLGHGDSRRQPASSPCSTTRKSGDRSQTLARNAASRSPGQIVLRSDQRSGFRSWSALPTGKGSSDVRIAAAHRREQVDYGPHGGDGYGLYGRAVQGGYSEGQIMGIVNSFPGTFVENFPVPWISLSSRRTPPREALGTHETFNLDERLVSANGRFTLIMQGDGSLVLYGPNQRALWASETYGSPRGTYLAMQGDGNLVLHCPDGRPVWSSGTYGYAACVLIMRNDGNLVLYGPVTGRFGLPKHRDKCRGAGAGGTSVDDGCVRVDRRRTLSRP